MEIEPPTSVAYRAKFEEAEAKLIEIRKLMKIHKTNYQKKGSSIGIGLRFSWLALPSLTELCNRLDEIVDILK